MAPHNRPLISSIQSHERRLSQPQPPSKLGLIVPAPWQNPSPDLQRSDFSRNGHQGVGQLIIGCPQSQETVQWTHGSDSESSALLSVQFHLLPACFPERGWCIIIPVHPFFPFKTWIMFMETPLWILTWGVTLGDLMFIPQKDAFLTCKML